MEFKFVHEYDSCTDGSIYKGTAMVVLGEVDYIRYATKPVNAYEVHIVRERYRGMTDGPYTFFFTR